MKMLKLEELIIRFELGEAIGDSVIGDWEEIVSVKKKGKGVEIKRESHEGGQRRIATSSSSSLVINENCLFQFGGVIKNWRGEGKSLIERLKYCLALERPWKRLGLH